MTLSGKRLAWLIASVVWTTAILLQAAPFRQQAYAAQITSRSLTLQGVGVNGGSAPNVLANHLFTFTLPSDQTLGSIKFQYCKAATGTCNAPTGLDTSGVSLGTSTGAAFTTAVSDSANVAHVTRAPAAFDHTLDNPVVVQLLNVHNPDASNCFSGSLPQANNCTFYVRIFTYATTDTSGAETDTGVVAASTVTQIQLSGYMPESLIFCTGQTINTTSGVPDCSTAGTGTINFPDFSPAATSFTTSQMAASTNADTGYSITYTGATMTSGGNIITPMDDGAGGPTTSIPGTSQFGLNLVDNTTPNVGSAITPASNAGNKLLANPATNYGTADSFLFKTAGDAVAQSNFGGTLGPTNAQIYTVSYIVNVDGAQPVGTYSTTLSYICTATF